ncbi:hypothetical protein RF11_07188 [Thelohanellus kitauei]|uniref:Uncharacterized protein n=1 Tax=Thelohanellus kitauei TaxID=669202 RepID=A0A0C2MTA3_THEKT|nr:hypothetical protein RF11_07188 [Thelohanellus kitauei]
MIGWRALCPTGLFMSSYMADIFYDPSLSKFRIKFIIEDPYYIKTEISAIEVEDKMIRNLRESEFILMNVKIHKLDVDSIRSGSNHFTITQPNILPLFPMNFRQYHCKLDEFKHILTEYAFEDVIFETCMQMLSLYGEEAQIRIYENVPSERSEACKSNSSCTNNLHLDISNESGLKF